MTRTILLADDSVTIQKVVELTFLDEDFKVVTVGDGAEAIGRLTDARPDLVIADVHMPGADGYEVAEAVRRTLPATSVLLLVGTFEVFDADRAARAGASGHLKKPFDSQELLRRVKELLASGPTAVAAPPQAAPGPRETVAVPAMGSRFWEQQEAAQPTLETHFEPAAAEPAPASEETSPGEAEPEAMEYVPEYEPEIERVDMGATASAAASAPRNGPLSDQDVDRIARRVVELIGDGVLRDVAWEVVPDLAEVLLKARIRELEASVE